MTYPTSRKFPRTLAEAWPREHANPVEFYPAPLSLGNLVRAAVLVACCVFIGWLAAQAV